jgi:hypothetical protein
MKPDEQKDLIDKADRVVEGFVNDISEDLERDLAEEYQRREWEEGVSRWILYGIGTVLIIALSVAIALVITSVR